jgi:hypothetical protein
MDGATANERRKVISRKPGQSITIADAETGRKTVIVHRAPAGAMEVLPDAGIVVARTELLDNCAEVGED